MKVDQIDNDSFSKDLIYYKNKILNVVKEKEYNNNNLDFKEFNLGGNISSDHSPEESFEIYENEENNNDDYDKINGFVKSINYIINYSQMKEKINNEKYIIIFTDMLNVPLIEDESIKDIFEKLNGSKFIILLLVGKKKNSKLQKDIINNNIGNIKDIEDLILGKFGEKSEVIPFENMKKIKTILSNNKVIKDQVFYPNEIYK